MRHIVYLVMDSIQIVKECATSIHSLHHVMKDKQPENYHIVIYTNVMEEFEKYNLSDLFSVEFIPISDALKYKWIRDTRYIYKIKIYAVLDYLQKKGEPLVFLDADTFLLKDIEPLFDLLYNHKQMVWMNYPEKKPKQLQENSSPVEKPRIQDKIDQDFLSLSNLAVGGKCFEIKEDFSFWNSGVLGLTPDMKDRLEDALILTDYVLNKYRMLTSEQIALSIALSQDYQIVPADHIVYHYWFLKEARYLVQAALKLPIEFEPKYLLSPVKQFLDQDNAVEYSELEDKIEHFLGKRNAGYTKGVYHITRFSRYLRQSVKNYV